jgi:hypothetical protein
MAVMRDFEAGVILEALACNLEIFCSTRLDFQQKKNPDYVRLKKNMAVILNKNLYLILGFLTLSKQALYTHA